MSNVDPPYLSLAEAVARLGEAGEQALANAHVTGKVCLHGRCRRGAETADRPTSIPPDALAEWKPNEDSAICFNLISNSIEANACNLNFAVFERHARYGWIDVQVPTHELAALVKSRANGKHASNLAETNCRQWLTETMKTERDHPRPKAGLYTEAAKMFPQLSNRGFNRAWAKAAMDADADTWVKGGRRRK